MNNQKANSDAVPDYPKAFVEGCLVIFIDEKGKRNVWGREANPLTAQETAEEIEQGLRSIRHARRRLVEAIETTIRELGEVDIPEGLLIESICEAYWSIQMKLPGLVESLVEADSNR
ncbi:hypothetical protein H8E65_06960 [Candidatus Bathyarchaeota archaeon]|nr:hypothetical protein [Candidatus Bathyarchaeota archaeon]MBL7079585.1 hypothetical protein [Candidatus Bathyarchaeota archaeon]